MMRRLRRYQRPGKLGCYAILAEFLGSIEQAIGRNAVLLVPMIEGAVLDARTIASASRRVFALMTGGEDLATTHH